jgi:ABC-type branched-subunit amino acid transport system substrate-binding protein
MPTWSSWRVIGVAVVLALTAGACGSGRSPGSADPGDGSGTPATTPVAEGSFGTLAPVCGPGDASGATAQGVTDTAIEIGYGDDAGYGPNPGVGHQASDAVKALIGWCNEQGGINGRPVEGVYYDAKITEVNNVMTEACKEVFMLVGQVFALAGSAETTRLGCGLPTVPGSTSGSDITNAPLMVSPYPQPVDYFNVGGASLIAEQFPEEVKRTGVMEPNFPAVIDYDQRIAGAVGTVGFEFLPCKIQYAISGVSDFRPYLQRLKDCGVETVMTTDIELNFQNMLDAANQLDFHPVWINIPTIYTETFAKANTSGNADRVYFPNGMVPLDYVPEGSANARYVELVEANGGDPGYSGQLAASAFLLWATAAKACGSDLTRECVMAELKEVHEWTGGGLSSPQDPGANMVGQCELVMHVEGTSFVQWEPTEEGQFSCDPSYVVKVDPVPDAVAGLDLDGDRVARKNLP